MQVNVQRMLPVSVLQPHRARHAQTTTLLIGQLESFDSTLLSYMYFCTNIIFNVRQVDVFALGCILNECWTRRRPWEGMDLMQVNVHCEKPSWLPGSLCRAATSRCCPLMWNPALTQP